MRAQALAAQVESQAVLARAPVVRRQAHRSDDLGPWTSDVEATHREGFLKEGGERASDDFDDVWHGDACLHRLIACVQTLTLSGLQATIAP